MIITERRQPPEKTIDTTTLIFSASPNVALKINPYRENITGIKLNRLEIYIKGWLASN
jgi:hypothetical protein